MEGAPKVKNQHFFEKEENCSQREGEIDNGTADDFGSVSRSRRLSQPRIEARCFETLFSLSPSAKLFDEFKVAVRENFSDTHDLPFNFSHARLLKPISILPG